MKPYLLLSALVWLLFPADLNAQTTTTGNTAPVKSTADLIHDIQIESDGGVKADAARKLALQTRRIDVITAGLTAPSYNVRSDCIKSLSLFPVDQQKQALAIALGNNSAWIEEFPGESRAGQEGVCEQMVEKLKGFGISITWKDLLNPATRKAIVGQLSR